VGGPRQRAGLPVSPRFQKSKVEPGQKQPLQPLFALARTPSNPGITPQQHSRFCLSGGRWITAGSLWPGCAHPLPRRSQPLALGPSSSHHHSLRLSCGSPRPLAGVCVFCVCEREGRKEAQRGKVDGRHSRFPLLALITGFIKTFPSPSSPSSATTHLHTAKRYHIPPPGSPSIFSRANFQTGSLRGSPLPLPQSATT